MIDLRCEACGAPLPAKEGEQICECLSCGSRWYVADIIEPETAELMKNASELRQSYEFDRALSLYDKIIQRNPTELKAYWGAILCKYGVAYVNDPATGKKIPTCHRTSFNSVTNDPDFKRLEGNATEEKLPLYIEKAEELETLRKSIIKVSENEQPYDIFICYKETDEFGGRTLDSVDAQTVYDKLTEKKYRVFFSRITLSEHAGEMYEPYIFSALASAKVMLVFGCKKEYFEAVWVKNEWSRFLNMMAVDKNKRIIPCYRDMSAYDMPNELLSFQGADRSKIGWEQDLMVGVEKFVNPAAVVKVPVAVGGAAASPESILEFADINRRSGNFDKARLNYDGVLRINPKMHTAYWGLMLAENGYCDENVMVSDTAAHNIVESFLGTNICASMSLSKARTVVEMSLGSNLENAMTYADEESKKIYDGYITELSKNVSEFSKIIALRNTERLRDNAETVADYEEAAKAYRGLGENQKADECDAVVKKIKHRQQRIARNESVQSAATLIGVLVIIGAAIAYFIIYFRLFPEYAAEGKSGWAGYIQLLMPIGVTSVLVGLFMGVVAEINDIPFTFICPIAAVILAVGSVIEVGIYDLGILTEVFFLGGIILLVLYFLAAIVCSMVTGFVAKLITKLIIAISEIGL